MLLPLTFFRIPRTAAAPSAAPSVNGMCQNCTWDRDIFHIVRASCGRLFFYVPESLLEGSRTARLLRRKPRPCCRPRRRPAHSPSADKPAAILLPWESVFVFFFDGPGRRSPSLPSPPPPFPPHPAEKRGKFRLGRGPDTFCTQSVYLSDEKSTIKSRVENLEF